MMMRIVATGPLWPTVVLLLAALLVPVAVHGADALPAALAPVEVHAAGFRDLRGITVDADGHVFVADRAAGTVTKLAPEGRRTVVARGLQQPVGLAFDASGRLLIAEERAGRVVRVEANGRRTTIVSGLRDPRWLAVREDGTVYISARRLPRDHGHDRDDESAEKDMILRLSPAGRLAIFTSGFANLQGLALDGETLFAASQGRRDDAERHDRDDEDDDGVVWSIPILPDGKAGRAVAYGPSDQFEQPRGLAVDRLGALYLTTKELELGHRESKRAIAKLHTAGEVSLFAARLEDPQGLAFDADGNLYLTDGESGRVLKFVAPAAPTVTGTVAAR
jgi:sugar lactone lactonase YvrE